MKYDFTLPDSELRKAFALKWIAKICSLGTETGISFEEPEEIASAVAEKTEGWSFAILKELYVHSGFMLGTHYLTMMYCRFVSFLLRVAHDKALRNKGAEVPLEPAHVLLLKQVDQLAAQIIKSKDDVAEAKQPGVAHPSVYRSVRAVPAMFQTPVSMGGMSVHPGTNF